MERASRSPGAKVVDQEAWRTSRKGRELNGVILKEQGLSQDERECRNSLGSQEDCRPIP